MKKNKLIFFGTPNFSVAFLNALFYNKQFEILAIVTETDKKSGRGNKISFSAVKKYALTKRIKLFQPKRLIGFEKEINNIKPDLIVVVAYGKIIPEKLLNLSKFATINVHPSDLPKYRGPSPIQSVILAGEKMTAISIMKMDKLMDHGPILDKKLINISENENYFSLEEKILNIGPKFLIDTLNKYLKGKIKEKKQKHKYATFSQLLKKEDGKINWNNDMKKINNQINALCLWPKAYSYINKKRLIFLKSKIVNGKIKPILVQLEGKRPIDWKSFYCGYKNILPKELTNKTF